MNLNPLPHHIRRQPKTERANPNHLSKKKMKTSFDKRSKIPCQWRYCTNPSCCYRHPPVCQNCISETGCIHSRNCCFRHKKPNKKSRKGDAKGSVVVNCVSQDPHLKKSILRKEGSGHKGQFSRCTCHNIKIRERMGPSFAEGYGSVSLWLSGKGTEQGKWETFRLKNALGTLSGWSH